ncbi:MAG: ImmA/IrrE family metallo-endopeptidase, partial [Verrucomicrobia bacterium]|nr:ImmA/IrrE family metallo-endopeptidase [Verrucomicrobiota bacterium]
PDIQRAVTASEARELGHVPKRGATKASIWVPVFEGGQDHRSHQLAVERQTKWAKDAGVGFAEISSVVQEYEAWRARKIEEIRDETEFLVSAEKITEAEVAGRVEDQIQFTVSLEAFLTTNYHEQLADEKIAQDFRGLIESAIEQLGVFSPAPPCQGARVGWTVVPCVLDLGKDTDGPLLDLPGKQVDLEEGTRFLRATTMFAEARGHKVTTDAGSTGVGEEGYAGAHTKADGTTETKINLARWTGLTSKCSTMLHEIAHVLAGHLKLSRDNKDKHEQSKSMEHVAEATAYIVGRQFGMPMEYSAVYLKQWGANPAELERHLATVRDLSKDMILGIGEQLEIVRREEQASRVNNQALAQETNHEEQIPETFVRYQSRLYGEDQVTDLMAAFGASENLLAERVELLNNVAEPGEDPKFLSIEKLSAKNYQTRLLLEFAESVAESEGAKFVWIDSDGYFDFAIDPDDVPAGVQPVPVPGEQGRSVVAMV